MSIWAPFAFLALNFFSFPLYAATCSASDTQFHETVNVSHVYDGDTIKLSDGRKLRLIGINTPERGKSGSTDEPFYQTAKNQLQQIIRSSQNKVKIVYGQDKYDRYKRLLAHIFTLKNENITATLLKKGMGFIVAIPPNIQLLRCYQNAVQTAKKSKHGIWNHQYSHSIKAEQLKPSARGFHRISGEVRRIGESRSSYWLNLSPEFALRILKKNLPYFTQYQIKDLLGQQVIAQGWIYKKNKQQRITIHHPASLQIQNTD